MLLLILIPVWSWSKKLIIREVYMYAWFWVRIVCQNHEKIKFDNKLKTSPPTENSSIARTSLPLWFNRQYFEGKRSRFKTRQWQCEIMSKMDRSLVRTNIWPAIELPWFTSSQMFCQAGVWRALGIGDSTFREKKKIIDSKKNNLSITKMLKHVVILLSKELKTFSHIQSNAS